ncbi:branched-chain amino acid ABC transporter permease [Streptomyces sp. NPDC006668]|uniref:branched-chain amino acid ABC transporter permease n=1 Tax=Streptomyces sp. NPDC006668 TaxID=3156903 RepID=UPI00340E9155
MAALATATIAAFALAPALSLGQLDLSVTLLTYLTIAQAWNVLAGFSGQISLGAAAFMAAGGYTTALILVHTGLPWPVAFLGAGVGAALLALLLAVPLLRLRGDYFAVGTLAVSIALQALLSNWNWAGGASGLTLPTERIPSGGNLYQITVVVTTLAMALTLYVRHSAFGLRLTAVRDNEPAAAGLGVSVYRHRLAALIPTSALTGLAGAVIAFQFVVISPDGVASVNWSLNAVLMSVVGGAGTVLGPVVGVGIVYYGLTRLLQDQQTLSLVIEGLLLVLIVRFAPQGVWPLVCRALRFPAARRRVSPATAETGSDSSPQRVCQP